MVLEKNTEVSWTDNVENEKVLHKVKEKKEYPTTIIRRRANWNGHILCRNCLLERITEGKMEGTIELKGKQGRRCQQLLDGLEETRRYSKNLKRKH